MLTHILTYLYSVSQLRPLHELVKEVQCAGLKKLHLKRATEEYLAQEHPCRCRPCRSNGRPLLTAGSECSCVCRPGTSGLACDIGAATGEQPGEWTRDSESAMGSLDVETAHRTTRSESFSPSLRAHPWQLELLVLVGILLRGSKVTDQKLQQPRPQPRWPPVLRTAAGGEAV